MREEKRSEIIHDALNFLDDEMIEEVGKLREKEEQQPMKGNGIQPSRRKLKNWHKWTSLAACLCVLIIACGLWYGIGNDGIGNSSDM